ncbi:MAG: hypothetical protein LUF92_16275, partial [Clostridiales bacterium]|nr:hypothetical protein [Clostridiales bacterium]
VEERKRISLENAKRNGNIISGARNIKDPNTEESCKWAESYYNQIRAQSTDCEKIAKRLNVDIKDVRKIKNYLFYDKSLYDEDLEIWRRFDADAAIAQSW